jgi:hypothetical protein
VRTLIRGYCRSGSLGTFGCRFATLLSTAHLKANTFFPPGDMKIFCVQSLQPFVHFQLCLASSVQLFQHAWVPMESRRNLLPCDGTPSATNVPLNRLRVHKVGGLRLSRARARVCVCGGGGGGDCNATSAPKHTQTHTHKTCMQGESLTQGLPLPTRLARASRVATCCRRRESQK